MTMGDEACGGEHQDHYSAAIELSNNCRRFYFNHVKTTEAFKKSVHNSRRRNVKPNGTVKSRLDAAMDKLRTEMAELMDQDLSLMEQLLTLNDKIEEVKQKCMYSISKDSLGTSSCNLSAYHDYTDSEMSLASLDINDYNEDCMFGSDLDVRTKGTEATDEVFEEGSVDVAFRRWVKKQSKLEEDSSSEVEDELDKNTNKSCVTTKFIEKSQVNNQRHRSEGFVVSHKSDSDAFEEKSEELIDFTSSDINVFSSPVSRKDNGKTDKNDCIGQKMCTEVSVNDKSKSRDDAPAIIVSDCDADGQSRIAFKLNNPCAMNKECGETIEPAVTQQTDCGPPENDVNCDKKHLVFNAQSNIIDEGANNSYDSDDNLNIQDYEDTILNA